MTVRFSCGIVLLMITAVQMQSTTCEDPVQCFADPCSVSTCPDFPEAVCNPSYCGGCFAIYRDPTTGDLVECGGSGAQDVIPVTCPEDQVFNSCGMSCNRTCDDPTPMCTKECAPRCECKETHLLNTEGKCVPAESCPPQKCKPEMEFTECGSACERTCRKPSTDICTLQCVRGCECPAATPIEHQGRCIVEEDCPECPSNMVWMECGRPRDCERTCTTPDPVCPEMCVSRCQCPDETPILHEGKCVGKDSCQGDGFCTGDDGTVYTNGDQWDTADPCTTCWCDSNKKSCDTMACAFPVCDIGYDVIYEPKKCCPTCEMCAFEGQIYKPGDSWKPDPCVQCQCLVNEDNVKTAVCAATLCEKCEVGYEEVWKDGQCCATCKPISECTPGTTWANDECTNCTCEQTNGSPKVRCSSCPRPMDPSQCIKIPGQCCPDCLQGDQCGVYEGKQLVHIYEIGEEWDVDQCTHCTCTLHQKWGLARCYADACEDLKDCPADQIYQSPDTCCPVCLNKIQCTDVNGAVHGPNDKPWPLDPSNPCTTCTCDDKNVTQCGTIYCSIPICILPSLIVYDKNQCCPGCSDECTYDEVLHDVGATWREGCSTCSCGTDSAGGMRKKCTKVDCNPIPGTCDPLRTVTPPGKCCSECRPECSMWDETAGDWREYPADKDDKSSWKPDPCTFCACSSDPTTGAKKEMCAVMDCMMPDPNCDVYITKPGACCPVCMDECVLRKEIKNGRAVDRMGEGGKARYIYECKPGFWFPDGLNMGYCDKQGEGVYPVCEKQLLAVRLENEEDTTKILVSNSTEGTFEGFACDAGFRDGTAKIICRENGFADGRRGAPVYIHKTEVFKWTNVRCGEGSGIGACSADRYTENNPNPFPCKKAASVSCFNKPLEVNIKRRNTKRKYISVKIAVREDGLAIDDQDMKTLIEERSSKSNVDESGYFKIKAGETLHDLTPKWKRGGLRLQLNNGRMTKFKNGCYSVVLILPRYGSFESEQFC